MLGLQNYLVVGLGGFLGAIARLWVAEYIAQRMGTRFPYGTFLINCSGSFAIGLVVTILDHYAHWTANWRYLLPIGFIGAYTTFSTFEFETLRSIQDGQFVVATANVTLSVVLGFACVYAGVVAGNSVVRFAAPATSVKATELNGGVYSTAAPDLRAAENPQLASD